MRGCRGQLAWAWSVAVMFVNGAAWAAAWEPPSISLPADVRHPAIACTPVELERLRAAYRGSGAEHDVVAAVVSRAARCVGRPVAYPPRGGQHNQWYQCDKCQTGLRTVDDTHHRCPRCKTIYTGEPYDDVIFSRKHGENLGNLEAAAWAYAITKEARYAQFARSVLLGYAERYASYPYHDSGRRTGKSASRSGGHLFEQTLNEAACLAGEIAPAYDLVYGSANLSPSDHEQIRTGLLLPMLRNLDKNKAGKGNWQTWHNAAMFWAAPLVGDVAWARKAITQPGNGFVHQMEASVSDDGLWYENSWGYHFYTLRAMVHIVEGARRVGADLWSHPALKKMFTLPVAYAMPDGSLPRFGDDVHTTIGHASGYLEFAWHAYHDPAMASHLPLRPTWDSVLLGRKAGERPPATPPASQVFKASGHAVLRGRDPAGLTAVMTFGPYGGFHGHFDKLSFVFFGYGQELGVDPGRAKSQAYRLPVHRDWYKATLSHNTVLVDGRPQQPVAGRLEFFAASDECTAVVARCEEAYPGIAHRRLLCLLPGRLLVLDELKATSSAARRFDWVYHHRGTQLACEAAQTDDKLGEEYPGQEYVAHVKSRRSAGPVRATFVGPKVATYLVANAAAETEVRVGDGVGESVADRVPLAMLTRRGHQTRFAVVLEPAPIGQACQTTEVVADAAGGETRITIRREGSVDQLTLRADGKVRLRVATKDVVWKETTE